MARQVPLPSRFDIHGATLLPMAKPAANPNPMTVKTSGPMPRTSWAKSTSTEPLRVDAKFINPRMIAIERSRSLAHNQRKPSASSRRQCACTWSSGRSARNVPGIAATRAAAAKNDAASTKKGSENATSSSNEPSGGPTKVLAMTSALHIRPLAFSSWSTSTIDGMNVCPQLSRSTSAVPSSKVATSSRT